MKILIDARVLAKGVNSGIEEYTRNITAEILKIDKVNSYDLFYNGFKKQPLDIARGGIIDTHVPNKIFDAASRFLNWPKIDRLAKADVIFSPHFNILAVDKAPRVITFHDLSFAHHPYFFSRRQRFWHWLQDARRQAEQAAKIIAVSEFTKSDLVTLWNTPPEKIEVFSSGISEDLTVASPAICHPLISNRYFLYLGTIEPRKNLIAIIRAFNLLKTRRDFKESKLIIAGRRGWLYDKILREAANSPFNKEIIFWGPVDASQKRELYRQASVFVFPSFFEGFGFPPLEAQACGCPVVASDRTSLPEILGKSAILVNPWKIDQLADAIIAAAGASGEKLRVAGRENIKRFSWEQAARQTIKVLNNHGPR